MQELMSRHKTYSLSPRDCLKTCLFQKWQRMVAPPGWQDNTHGGTQTHTINNMCNFCYSLFVQLSHQDRLLTSGGSARCQAAAPSAEEEEQTTTTTTKRRVLARASRCPARCRWVQRCSLVLALFHYTLNRDVVSERNSVLKVRGTLKQKVIMWFLQTH